MTMGYFVLILVITLINLLDSMMSEDVPVTSDYTIYHVTLKQLYNIKHAFYLKKEGGLDEIF